MDKTVRGTPPVIRHPIAPFPSVTVPLPYRRFSLSEPRRLKNTVFETKKQRNPRETFRFFRRPETCSAGGTVPKRFPATEDGFRPLPEQNAPD
ncbi:MAG: hypothetical protein LBR53_09250 [Deltaproteobacteria bacterium]|nr:hypothetical protein [Deltaproteobacteria bacterium]